MSLAEVAAQDWDGTFWDRTSGDLRSLLWLVAAQSGGDDWRVFETDPGFAVLSVSEATFEAEFTTPTPGKPGHAVFDGLHDPVTVLDSGGGVAQVLWPVVVDVKIQRTDAQAGLVHHHARFGTTLLLVPDLAADGGFLIEATVVPDGFIQHSAVVISAS